jgi:homoserine O-acetyltransferase/O-succinyltransferase
LGIKKISCVIGGSMGGMQVLEWAFVGGDLVRSIVPIATSAKQSAWCISCSEAQRMCIKADKNYSDGNYTDIPAGGLMAARMQALLSYRSPISFERRFGRELCGNKKYKYQAESYLHYQGEKFVKRFDANCYIVTTKMIDSHDISRGRGTIEEALKSIRQPTLIISVSSDLLYQEYEHKLMRDNIPNSQWVVLQSDEGHDGFLLEFEEMERRIKEWFSVTLPEHILSEFTVSNELGKQVEEQNGQALISED